MVGLNRKIKLFNRTFQEFLKEYRLVSGVEIPPNKIKRVEPLQEYHADVAYWIAEFLKCDDYCLPKIKLLNFIDLENTKIINWEYLHNLYFITLPEPDPQLVEKSKENIENHRAELTKAAEKEAKEAEALATKAVVSQKDSKDPGIDFAKLSGLLGGAEGASGQMGDLNNVIQDIAAQVTDTLKGVDISKINPNELAASLMSGNTKACGIDFTDIINNATRDINKKIKNGDLDANKLKETAEGLLGEVSTS